MIISRTPLRVSFCGGGTDLSSYYLKEYGAVTTTAINKYMYVTVNKRFDDDIRVGYSQTETVDNVDKLKHDLVRECLRLMEIKKKIEVTTIADVPGKGTGLGSSSSLAVGLLNALHAFKDKYAPAERLAKQACSVEIDMLKKPIGKQDQYIAAYGGLKHIQFSPDENVLVENIICSKSTKKELEENLLLFYTGATRKAEDILSEQTKNTPKKIEILRKMRDLALELRDSIVENNINSFGELLDRNWHYKKQLAGGITNQVIDDYYEKAKKAGAIGGKLLGAGGGGFLLFYCPEEKQKRLKQALQDLREEPFRFEPHGSKIIFVDDSWNS